MKSHLPPEDYIVHKGITYVKVSKCEEHLQTETNKRINQLYDEVGKDVIAQVSAVYLSVLNKDFKFGADRLKRVFEGTKSMFKAMNDKAVFNKKFDPDDCIAFIKNKFGIDVFKE